MLLFISSEGNIWARASINWIEITLGNGLLSYVLSILYFLTPPTVLLTVDCICCLLQPVSDPVIPKISSSLFPWSYCFTKFLTLLCGLHWIPVVYWIPLYLYSSCSTIITLSQGSSPHICFYSRFLIISLQLTSIYSYDVIGETDF